MARLPLSSLLRSRDKCAQPMARDQSSQKFATEPPKPSAVIFS
jgi:hypothetical protein